MVAAAVTSADFVDTIIVADASVRLDLRDRERCDFLSLPVLLVLLVAPPSAPRHPPADFDTDDFDDLLFGLDVVELPPPPLLEKPSTVLADASDGCCFEWCRL